MKMEQQLPQLTQDDYTYINIQLNERFERNKTFILRVDDQNVIDVRIFLLYINLYMCHIDFQKVN